MPSPPTVLVVEDQPAQSELVRDILQSNGYHVECVAEGAAALARVDAGGIDLVLLDIALPGMDGVAVCQRMHAAERPVHLPIILLSALGDATLHQTLTAAGADECIAKPFDIYELLTVVARHCAAA